MDGGDILVYLIGKPGVGKYTVARELARQYKFVVCDNHLINNPIFGLLGDMTHVPGFVWDYTDQIRSIVFAFLRRTRGSCVLTNYLTNVKADRELYRQVVELALARSSRFIPVILYITPQEHIKRIVAPERELRHKLTDPGKIDKLPELLHIEHPNLLHLDITDLTPGKAVEKIMDWAGQASE